MRLEWGHEDIVAPWVARQIGLEAPFGECRTGAVLTSFDELACGLVFHNWSPEAGVMEVSGAAVNPMWAQRGVLREMFNYIFDRAGNQIAVLRTHPENPRARRIWKALGGSEYEIPRLRGRNTSEIISTLTDDAWRASKFAR